ncbi:MAG: flagellar basal body rod protein FlgB [Candidatus Eremiobacteraeota bacterium]|nr:flagellar basal body rod protein FlgB [Candidatus Eremiobacteraeota bacterium]
MSDISALSFGSAVDLLSNAMSGAGIEHQAIAENIANVNTPNYERQTVSFKDALAAAAGSPSDSSDLELQTNSDRQFVDDSGQSTAAFDPQITADSTRQMRADGSNVDVDQEMAQLSQNSSYSQTMAQLLQVQFMRLREAITEQPH